MMAHAEQLHALLTDARFEVVAWNDLTEPSTQVMHAFLNAPPQPLGLHVFVPDFRTKATNLIEALAGIAKRFELLIHRPSCGQLVNRSGVLLDNDRPIAR